MKVLKETADGITEACHADCERVKMKCLSVRQPSANAIFFLGKDVENRSWPTTYRGPLLIYAASASTAKRSTSTATPAAPCVTGAIIGIVNLLGMRRNSDSRWAQPGLLALAPDRRQARWPSPSPVPGSSESSRSKSREAP